MENNRVPTAFAGFFSVIVESIMGWRIARKK
jgi:hypothetical protein